MKHFSIFKNTKKKEGSTAPDYKMSAKIDDDYVEIGACWLKDGKSGKYFSCKLNDTYVDPVKNVARNGFELALEPLPETTESTPAPHVEVIDPETGKDLNDNPPF